MSNKYPPATDEQGVRRTYKALTKAGYTIGVLDGAGEEFPAPMSKEDAVAEVRSCDEGYFLVYKDGERVGWVWFVYGNDPGEVICDHTINLSHVLDPLTENWL